MKMRLFGLISQALATRNQFSPTRPALKANSLTPFLLRWTVAASMLAATVLYGQLTYWAGYFDLEISFGCNCCCDTNNITNSPIGAFLATNGVTRVDGTAGLATRASATQYIPPHWALLDSGALEFEGWTEMPEMTPPRLALGGRFSQRRATSAIPFILIP